MLALAEKSQGQSSGQPTANVALRLAVLGRHAQAPVGRLEGLVGSLLGTDTSASRQW